MSRSVVVALIQSYTCKAEFTNGLFSLWPQGTREPPANCGRHRKSQLPVCDLFDKGASTVYVLIIHEI